MKKANIFFQSIFFIVFATALILILKKPTIDSKTNDRIINIYVWGDFFNVDLIRDFEKRHNAKINLNYYLNNEELLAKIRNSNGNCADLIFPSDYAIKSLIHENYLQKLDHKKLNFFNKLNPFILDKSFDPKNIYSLPYTWEVYGILSNKNNTDLASIKTMKNLLTNQTIKKIVMPSDPIEVFCIASQALYNDLEEKNTHEFEEISEVLKNQRERILAYVDYQAKFIFASKCSSIGYTRSSYFSLIADENNNHGLQFILPHDGLFVSIENLAILKHTKNKELIYKFINDIYTEQNMLTHIHECPMYPAIETLMSKLDFPKEYFDIYKQIKRHKNICFFNYFVPEEVIKKEWVKIKAT